MIVHGLIDNFRDKFPHLKPGLVYVDKEGVLSNETHETEKRICIGTLKASGVLELLTTMPEGTD